MQQITVLICLCLFWVSGNAQGKFAGSHKKWLKQEVVKENEASYFKGYTAVGYCLLQTDDETEHSLVFYKKGSTQVLLLITQITDALSYTIQDVIEIRNMSSKDNIQQGTCNWNGSVNAKVIVLEKNIKNKPVNTSAWYTDTDKLRFTAISAKGISCIELSAD